MAKSQSERRRDIAQRNGFTTYYQYQKSRADQRARDAGWSSVKEYRAHIRAFTPKKQGGVYTGSKSAAWDKSKTRKNPYKDAKDHENAFMGFATNASDEARLEGKRRWLVDITGQWTTKQFNDRYKDALSELGLSV